VSPPLPVQGFSELDDGAPRVEQRLCWVSDMEVSRQDDPSIIDLLEYAINVLRTGPRDEHQLPRSAKPLFGYLLLLPRPLSLHHSCLHPSLPDVLVHRIPRALTHTLTSFPALTADPYVDVGRGRVAYIL